MAEGSPNEDIFGPSPDTNFTFTFGLNQEPPVNAKRPKASEWAPTPQASPSKKCIRVSKDVNRSPSPEGFCLPEDRETLFKSRPTTPRSQTPCPTSPPHSSRYSSPSPMNVDGDDPGSSSNISFEEPTVAVNSLLKEGKPKEPATVQKSSSGLLKNSKFTSFWSVETVGEREGRIQREFAALRDEAEVNAADEAHSQRLNSYGNALMIVSDNRSIGI